ncbi:MAG: hypothetical protein UR31_C0027G0008 [Parcubacteria group bacterium GW2011_GWA2_33_14]|uniref:Uncharacterized protein n=1 Tax=Candidatus Staskawiczbacteria bacterium RIFCSPHIGHO2_02_FULL_33_16 TaxID=1802204 RepID=A0A1G2HUU5_9BACT|nr:MAG: hypothetical protein UR31_C0027G0008 [Parcubacteria group bacterium GW2011_GWA2_33_14]OGZ66302.1 MAG: hypothetical protein A3D34_03195 [Candidatus Staskawiczbacteria bacterium RIFCSPHIGHO2_02_FULL_33_16]OGZ71064.1 MAG: hypothetical protein A2980_00205 [Candidatus Staskawiczbacteria bacterium RIFCSPLOWO2_01_FULL_33_13]
MKSIKRDIIYSFLIGLIYSLLIFLINYLAVFVLFFAEADGLLGAIFMIAAEKNDIPVVILSLIFTIPFFILNSITILVVKNKIRKVGLLCGYLLSILIFILVFGVYSSHVASLQNWDGFYMKILDNKGKLSFDFCQKGPDQFSKDFCLKELAMQNNNVLICDKIEEELELDHGGNDYASGRNPCIAGIAIKNNDPLICDKMDFNNPNDKDNLSRKDACYWNSIPLFNYWGTNDQDILLAQKNLDLYKKWCPFFKSDYFKEQCSVVLNSN